MLRSTRAALAAVLVVGLLAGCSAKRDSAKDIHIGKPGQPATTALPGPTVPPGPNPLGIQVPPTVDFGEPRPPPTGKPFTGLIDADGRPPGGAIAFRSDIPIPADLVFVLVVGSDARPREDPRKGHADSVHLLAVNPRSKRATIVGFPRDAWVQVPGRGNRKLTDVMPIGGPQLLAETIRNLTGLPVQYYVVTGFAGLPAMVDKLGGVELFIEQRMNDGYSGARFKPGWHHMNGEMILSFSRNRHDVPNGDFSRSENQGRVLVATLAKLREEVADDGGLRKWLEVLVQHAVLDIRPDQLSGLAALARGIDPGGVANVVVPGRVGTAGRASVVYLDGNASGRIFSDLRDDATLGTAPPPPPPPSTSTSPPPPPTTAEPTTTTTTDAVPETTLP